MKKIIKLLIPVIALIAGAVGGHFLKPDMTAAMAKMHDSTGHHDDSGHEGHDSASDKHEESGHDGGHATAEPSSHGGHGSGGAHGKESGPKIFKFSRQFFVPLLRRGDQGDIVILTIALQTTIEALSNLEARESLLRDAVNRRLFVIANTGGFDGNFTTQAKYDRLKVELLDALQRSVGDSVKAVLIEDIARQQG